MNQEFRINYPIQEHTQLFNQLPYKEIYIENTWLLIPKRIIKLLHDFIAFKNLHGSSVEKEVYHSMTEGQLIRRIFEKRAVTFVGSDDSYTLRDGSRGIGHWEDVGTDYEGGKVILKDYLSYDEIELSAFVSLSCFTPFLNNGSRHNCGSVVQERQPNGVYIGQIGTRFQKHNHMDYRFMMIDPDQNTRENGYGPDNTSIKGQFLSLWANFLGVNYFPTHDEAMQDPDKWLGRKPTASQSSIAHLNIEVYRRRVGINAEVFLKEANDRAQKLNKKAFCHAVGLGLGVWAVDRKLQQHITVEVHLDILNSSNYDHISHLYFAWFNDVADCDEISWPNQINGVQIHFGQREPAEPLEDPNLLLVANWAADANAFVGNEYWDGFLGSSGDPAAASCSFIAYFGNPYLCKIDEVHTW